MAAVACAGAWWATHPRPLPTTSEEIATATPTGRPTYVRIYAAAVDDGRTFRIRDVHLDQEGDPPADVALLVCRCGGVPVVTSDPSAFCDEVEDASDAAVDGDDALMLRVSSPEPGDTVIDEVVLSIRDGLQWGTQSVGPPVEVTFLEG